MLHKEIWGLTLLGFILWIFFTSNPNERIERVCKPVVWSGNVTTSIAALVTPGYQQKTQFWFDKLNYGCTYTVWRLFYQQEYNAYLKAHPEAAGRQPAADNGVAADNAVATKKGAQQ